MRYAVIIALLAAAGIGAYFYLADEPAAPLAETSGTPRANPRMPDVVVPELVGDAKIGERVFNAKCSVCHGENAAGNEGAGPPLVHKIYEPSHHGDAAFLLAARNGVRSHHWPYGNMAPVEGVTDGEVALVVEYIRTLQRANGIN